MVGKTKWNKELTRKSINRIIYLGKPELTYEVI